MEPWQEQCDESLLRFDTDSLGPIDQQRVQHLRQSYQHWTRVNLAYAEKPLESLSSDELDASATLLREEYLLSCYRNLALGRYSSRDQFLRACHRNLLFRGDIQQLWRRKQQVLAAKTTKRTEQQTQDKKRECVQDFVFIPK